MGNLKERIYMAIDLKSFYASVECRERNLDPLAVNLVVADSSRTEKTICLAVTPTLKSYGLSGRCRLFEVIQKVKEVNRQRQINAQNHQLIGKSYFDTELKNNKNLALDFIIAPPRMALYMEYSTRIYNIYLKYVAPEDMHVYSVDEVFLDVTDYLKLYQLTAKQLAQKMIADIYEQTGITATAGIGTNLYLCKVAMDIMAKHATPDKNGVRMAFLDEVTYRQQLWSHRPLTDFWRVGKGYATKLEKLGIYTMGDIALCSVGKQDEYLNEDTLYKLFGVNAELLIDHAWGYESCTMKDIHNYKPENNSLSQGQVLHCPYPYDKAKLVIKEMTDMLVLDLVEKKLTTDQLVLNIGYDIENLTSKNKRNNYKGEIVTDYYGRQVPKHAHGTTNLPIRCASTKIIMQAIEELFDKIIDPNLTVRRMNVTAMHVLSEDIIIPPKGTQMSLFEEDISPVMSEETLERERSVQQTLIGIKNKYGKNAIVKGMNLEEGGTAIERNGQIGGHKA